MAGNHLGVKFDNSSREFKRWSRMFPSLFASDDVARASYRAGRTDWYVEVVIRNHFVGGGRSVHTSYYKYDEVNHNYDNVVMELVPADIIDKVADKVEGFIVRHEYLLHR